MVPSDLSPLNEYVKSSQAAGKTDYGRTSQKHSALHLNISSFISLPAPNSVPGMKQQYIRHGKASVCEKHFVPPQ